MLCQGQRVPPEPRAAIDAGICLLTEDRRTEGLFLDLPVSENIVLPSLRQLRRFAERGAVENIMRRMDVQAGSADAPVRSLSGGNQQKVILGRWLLRDPAVLVMIEPTRGVDVGAKAELYRALETLAREGRAILIVSSDIPELLGVADSILVMVDGIVRRRFARGAVTEDELNLAIQGQAA